MTPTPDARPVSDDECVRFCEIALTLEYSDEMKRHFSNILQRLRELQSLRTRIASLEKALKEIAVHCVLPDALIDDQERVDRIEVIVRAAIDTEMKEGG